MKELKRQDFKRQKTLLGRALMAAGAAVVIGVPMAFAGGVPTQVVNSCMVCHGMNGENTLYPYIPRLAGQQEAYIVQQLQQIKDGVRNDPNANLYMLPVAQSLSNAQMKAIATYYSSQEGMNGATGGDHADAAAGKHIFMNGIPSHNVAACMACHGLHAQGNGTFPRLAGQRYGYIVQQLGYFKSGQRQNQIMHAIASGLSKQDMMDLASYVTSLK